MQGHFDVLIAGAGLVGLSLARALSGSGLSIGLIEPRTTLPPVGSALETRNLALARASVLSLQRLGALPESVAGEPIRHIHVSSRGQFGAARLHADAHRVPWFGRVFPAERLLAALDAAVAGCKDVTRVSPGQLVSFESGEGAVEALVREPTGERVFTAALLVAADGTDSPIRARLGIEVDTRDYEASALSCNVRLQRGLDGWAFERMGPLGPLAVLPLGGDLAGLVWTLPHGLANDRAQIPEDAFLEALQVELGWRFGRVLACGSRRAYPLRLCVSRQIQHTRVALIGNAAQTVHPLGAQGFNLGLRDALDLAAQIRSGGDPGAEEGLQDWARSREPDRRATIAQSDGLLRLFAQPLLPVRIARMLALLAFDRMVPLQHDLVMGSMGYRGQRSTLGLSTWQ